MTRRLREFSVERICADASRRGFTLLELAVILIVIGILAASVVPSLSVAADTRGAAATHAAERMLVLARSRAMATGEPAGVRISADAERLSLVALDTDRRSVEAVVTDGKPLKLNIASAYPGVSIGSVEGFDGSMAGSQTLWFGFDGAPEVRTDGGIRKGAAERDARVVLDGPGAGAVWVRQGSGVVEQ